MKHILREKFAEAVWAVLPLSALVVAFDAVLRFAFGSGMPPGILLQFVVGAAFVLVGIGLLALGEDLAMAHMGDRIGAKLSEKGKTGLLIISGFLIGLLVTMAEPNLTVFATLTPGIENGIVMVTAALGVGIFMALGIVRMVKRIPSQVTLTLIFLFVFGIAAFTPYSFIPVAFDVGGVATGPVTVSFIMAVGFGLASVRGGGRNAENSFGTVAFCTIGPIAAMLLLGIFGKGGDAAQDAAGSASADGAEIIMEFLRELLEFFKEVALALLPIVLLFAVFQLFFLKLHKRSLLRIGMGVVYTFLGHALFLTGVCVGFLHAGEFLGEAIASLPSGLHLLLIPAAMLMGGFVVMAEPGIHALNRQVETVTVGAVSRRAMNTMLCIGVMIADGLAMLRIITGVSLWYFLIGGYALAILLSLLVPKVFTAIAFDSGGVASGAMTVAFMLPFAKGACGALWNSPERVLTDAFGLISLVVIMPIITVQLLGLVYRLKLGHSALLLRGTDDSVEIIEFDGEAG